jgi:hypothetical protein
MKIISLASNIAGPACAIAKSVKNIYYNGNCQTNMFDYLEISLSSINKLLANKDILFDNLNIVINHNNSSSVTLCNYDKIISHHDLILNYNAVDLLKFKEKYIRRFIRLLQHLVEEDSIYFIRYGKENENDIYQFINIIKIINPSLKFKLIHLIYDEYNLEEIDNDNYILINFFKYLDNNKIYSDDLYYKTMELNWDIVFSKIKKYDE